MNLFRVIINAEVVTADINSKWTAFTEKQIKSVK